MSLQHQSVDARLRHRWHVGADRWLSLAAAPTFALMALVSATSSGGAIAEFCSSVGASPFGSMMAMYLLMSAFHSAPWLRLIADFWRNLSKETIHE